MFDPSAFVGSNEHRRLHNPRHTNYIYELRFLGDQDRTCIGCISLLLARLPKLLAHLNSIDRAILAIWTPINKYSLMCREMQPIS